MAFLSFYDDDGNSTTKASSGRRTSSTMGEAATFQCSLPLRLLLSVARCIWASTPHCHFCHPCAEIQCIRAEGHHLFMSLNPQCTVVPLSLYTYVPSCNHIPMSRCPHAKCHVPRYPYKSSCNITHVPTQAISQVHVS